MTELQFKKAIQFLKKNDPVLATVIKKVELQLRTPTNKYFEELASSIISQQLSLKAAATIKNRFVDLFQETILPRAPLGSPAKGRPWHFPKPKDILKMPDAKIRSAGLSGSKVKFIKDLAKRVDNGDLHFRGIETKSEEQIIEMLVAVKGIGRWTAEMFLMFALQRPDVYSHGDLGLRNAIKKLYKVRGELTQKKAEKIAEQWKPYRTLACRYLWASLELK